MHDDFEVTDCSTKAANNRVARLQIGLANRVLLRAWCAGDRIRLTHWGCTSLQIYPQNTIRVLDWGQRSKTVRASGISLITGQRGLGSASSRTLDAGCGLAVLALCLVQTVVGTPIVGRGVVPVAAGLASALLATLLLLTDDAGVLIGALIQVVLAFAVARGGSAHSCHAVHVPATRLRVGSR